jgi:acetylornithine deacetylase/succinyl-diaminopimelate desuccinylase-like protein
LTATHNLESVTTVEEAYELTARMVAIKSYPGEELAVQTFVAEWFRAENLPVEIQETTEPDRPNIIVRLENGSGPTILLNGHTDTVVADSNWSCDPWQGKRDGDRFYGLGACDMKSGVAAIMLATRWLDQHRDAWSGKVICAVVVDEEAYSIGARALIDSGLQADYCLVSESSFDWPCLGAFGKYLIHVDVIGKGAHASWPEKGINAAEEAAKFVARLGELDFPTHNVIKASHTTLSSLSGFETYVITIPEKATVLINRHTVPGETEESVLAQYRQLAESLGSAATFEFSIDPPRYPSWETSVDADVVRAFSDAYEAETGKAPQFAWRGYGDMNLFSTDAGISTVMFGPRGGEFHEADEWVDLPSIAASSRIIAKSVLSLLPA